MQRKPWRAALIAAVTLAGGSAWVPSSRAAIIVNFDPNGTAGATTLAVGQFDESPGNALAVNAIVNGSVIGGTPFRVLYQAKIGTLLGANNNILATPGQSTNGELTIVAQFNEVATPFGGGVTASFSTNTSQANSFVRIYFDPANNANDLTGAGFNDGTLIYEGQVQTDGGGGFTVFNPSAVNLDQSPNGNQYPGLTSVSGGGGTNLSVLTTLANPNFFLSPIAALGLSLNFNTSNIVPFNQVDPAAAMFDGTPAAIGGIGSFNGVTGPSFLFQADATASIVPEPASLVLTALGFAGTIGYGLRRRRLARP